MTDQRREIVRRFLGGERDYAVSGGLELDVDMVPVTVLDIIREFPATLTSQPFYWSCARRINLY